MVIMLFKFRMLNKHLKLSKPQAGHLKKSSNKGFKYSGEFQIDDPTSIS